MNTEELISGCIKNNPEARKALYTQYKGKLFPVCLKYCRSHAEAEDHLHDIFIVIFEKIKTYKGNGSFEGWMKRIAINKALDRYKKEINFELADYKLAKMTEEVYIDSNHALPYEELIKLIQGLPDQYRLVFNMYELDGYSHKEISNIIGISEGTSKSNLFRAKTRLKESILAYQKTNRK